MNYELVYILSPKLSDKDAENKSKDIIKQIKDNITEVILEDFWGKKDLAYPINKFEHGYYTLVQFKSEPKNINKIDKRLKLDDEVIRYLIVKKEEFFVAEQDKKKSGEKIDPDSNSIDENAEFAENKLSEEAVDETKKVPEIEVKDEKDKPAEKKNKKSEKKSKAGMSDLDKKLDDILDSEIVD